MTDQRSGLKRGGAERSTAGRDPQYGKRERLARGRVGPSDRVPKHLFDGWAQVSERIRSAEHLALFLDFDGTLAPFRLRPEEVRLSDGTRRALQRLVRHPQLRVFVLSGRRRADVKDRVGVPGVCCYGLHGWEGPTTGVPKLPASRLLREARRELGNRLSGLRGVWIEDKGPIFGVHVRGVAAGARRRAGDVVQDVMGRFEPGLGVLAGSEVWEVIPQELQGKGAKVRALLREMPAATLPIYLGDDATDETAFAVLRYGITVCVGVRRPTQARFDLRSPREVRTFLKDLESELPELGNNKAKRSQRARVQELRKPDK
jgi:trehalose 6-phosphate phosphatase